MHFLVDKDAKVIFGWSAKSGCTHIKFIYKYLKNEYDVTTPIKKMPNIHKNTYCDSLPEDIEHYTTIIISRNPFERLVSGFLDKYNRMNKESPGFWHLWKHDQITFSHFVDELITKTYTMIEKHHFTPQTSEYFDKIRLLQSKAIKVYDIHHIDYTYIESLYNKTIPRELILDDKYKNKNTYTKKTKPKEIFNDYVYDLDMKEYMNFIVPLHFFYNDEIRQKVQDFYKDDFSFFQEMLGYKYILPIPLTE